MEAFSTVRIRTVKPDFFTHPKVIRVSVPARLLFLSLLTQADDEGRLYDQPRKIGGNAFGEEDEVDVATNLAELATAGLVIRYEALGRRCLQIVGFGEHQVINRASPSTVPDQDGRIHGGFTEDSVNPQGTVTEDSRGEGKGRERKGKEDERLIADYLGRLKKQSPTPWREVETSEVLRVAAEYGFTALEAGRMLGDLWEWWRQVAPSKRWKKNAMRGVRSWMKRERERMDTAQQSEAPGEDREAKTAKLRADAIKRLQPEYGDRTESIVDRVLERFPEIPVETIVTFARRFAKEGSK